MTGGPEKWQKYGETLAKMSIEFAPTFWGFMAAFSETFAALLLMLGFLFRPATILLFITMFVAINHHLLGGDGWGV
ncbi:DoxX family protein, partial [Candidatus Saccharibacteria bacterium]|nr:DoxX family protein [Candidatus Saccharibacteria bacterium]NIV71976.1 DoxX family membrane protein [Calditrichia bacterium]NIW80674.1 DoxX family membrane protein [Calditrichia bacterium]